MLARSVGDARWLLMRLIVCTSCGISVSGQATSVNSTTIFSVLCQLMDADS
jgi:hypothetical protein